MAGRRRLGKSACVLHGGDFARHGAKDDYGARMACILILAALPEEADAVFPGQGTVEAGAFAPRSLSVDGHAVTIATCGLGKVNAALCAGMLGGAADLLVMSGTCGSLGPGPGAYWIAEAVQHDYGAAQPGLFRRYRAGEWPIGEAGEAHFVAMSDPGLGGGDRRRQRRQRRRFSRQSRPRGARRWRSDRASGRAGQRLSAATQARRAAGGERSPSANSRTVSRPRPCGI